MIFNEPKVEYVALNMEVMTYTSSQQCPKDEQYIGGTPSYELCSGPDAPGNNCTQYNFSMMINKMIQQGGTKSNNSSSKESHQFFNDFLPPMGS